MDFSNGWMKLPNDVFKTILAKRPSAFLLWAKLLSMARFKSGKEAGLFLNKGQCVVSFPMLKETIGLSQHTVEEAFKTLESCGAITREARNGKYTKVTINDFDKWYPDSDGPALPATPTLAENAKAASAEGDPSKNCYGTLAKNAKVQPPTLAENAKVASTEGDLSKNCYGTLAETAKHLSKNCYGTLAKTANKQYV